MNPFPNPTQPSSSSTYTSLQKSRQSRNRPTHKPPPTTTTTATASSSRSSQKQNQAQGLGMEAAYATDESFESTQKRLQAAAILENNEMLIWYSGARNESIPQTRLHFEKIVARIDSDDESVEWMEAYESEERKMRKGHVGGEERKNKKGPGGAGVGEKESGEGSRKKRRKV